MKNLYFVFFLLMFMTMANAQPYYVAGDFQGWNASGNQMFDDGTNGDVTAGDGIYTLAFTVPASGFHGFKITNGTWSTAWPSHDSWFTTTSDNQVVTFTFNTNTISDNWFPANNIVSTNEPKPTAIVAVGDWQSENGEAGDWTNNSSISVMHDDGIDGDFAAGDGIYTYHIHTLPAGSWSIKAVESGTWHAWGPDGRNQDAPNHSFTTTAPNQDVYFYLNTKTSRITVLLNSPMPVELSSFTASVSGKQVILKWTTATELNNSGFEVERFANNNWIKIGSVTGAGNSTSKKDYTFIDSKLISGKAKYRLKQIDYDGSFNYSGTVEAGIVIPEKNSLVQNYPNPFNPATKISYNVAASSSVTLKVYNVLGKVVADLVNERQDAGFYEVEFNASGLSSGIYFYELNTGGQRLVKKMNLLK